MKRLILFLLFGLGLLNTVEAKHLKGGWIQYEYLGSGATANTSKYRITVRQYATCGGNNVSPQDPQIIFGIFDASNNSLIENILIDSVVNGATYLNKESYNPCINPKPTVCYIIKKYVTTVDLPNNDAGYILAVQRCCRINTIVNVFNSGFVGITYYNKIPGGSYRNCNSPSFVQKDTVLVCYNAPFTFNFSATDTATAFAPADSVAYTFCDGFDGASHDNPGPALPTSPPYSLIPYNAPYNGSSPMGSGVTIDPQTGIISGTAPSTIGDYAVAVCALQFRDGILIASTKKEIHITVGDCSLKAAELKPAYINCNDLTFNFFNEAASSDIVKYYWNFGDTISSIKFDTSSAPTPTHIYADTGIYKIELMVTASGGCVDSAKSLVRVYPGFQAKFVVNSSCIKNPYQFIDSSYSKYGKVNNWSWNLGEPAAANDTTQDPSYTYKSAGQKTVTLKVANANGCIDSVTKIIMVLDNPKIVLPFDSTLICNTDTIQLSVSELNSISNATYKWTSLDSLSITNPNTPNPFVHPKNTAIYYVTLSDSGCFAKDSIVINTVPTIKVKAGPKDSSICQTDSIKLYALTQGTTIAWTSSTFGEKIDSVKTPWVTPLVNPTNYYVVASLRDKCFAKDTILVNVYPYPKVDAGGNDSVCFGNGITLHGTVVGDIFKWSSLDKSPIDSLNLIPYVTPDSTTKYALTAYYTKQNTCSKPKSDTITIGVIPKVLLNAGDDTTVVVNEPLHLEAKGNSDSVTASYLWTTKDGSPTFMNNNAIYNPVAIIPLGTDSIAYFVKATLKNPKECYAIDSVKVLVYQTPPEIFVPNVFTPNAGTYNIFKPILAGILLLDYFNVYNRFGQLLYTTSQIGKGWDGTYNGVPQQPGTYVYTVQGQNYLGKTLFGKGTVVLIR